MLRPVEMCKVNILVLRKHVAAVTQLLGARVDRQGHGGGNCKNAFR